MINPKTGRSTTLILDEANDETLSVHSLAQSASSIAPLSSSAYIVEDLFKDCERLIHQQYSVPPYRDIKVPLLREIWECIGRYIYQQVENLKSVSVNNIGRFSFMTNQRNQGTQGMMETKKAIFLLSEAFVRDFNLKQRRSFTKLVDNSIPTVEVNYFLVAQKCCTRKEVVLVAMKILRNRLGEVMSTGKKVKLDIYGVGCLSCDKRIVNEFEFVTSLSAPLKVRHQFKSNKFNSRKASLHQQQNAPNRVISPDDAESLSTSLREQSSVVIPSNISNNNSGPVNTRNSYTSDKRSRSTHDILRRKSFSNITIPKAPPSQHVIPLQLPEAPQEPEENVQAVNQTINTSRASIQPKNPTQFSPQPPQQPRPNSSSASTRSWDARSSSLLSHEKVMEQFTAATSFGPHENGFRQANPVAAQTTMNLALERFERDLELSRKEQQKDMDDFYKQLIHNICVDEGLRKARKQEANHVQNILKLQMQNQLIKKKEEDTRYSNFFEDPKDANLDNNSNSVLLGMKKQRVISSKPIVPLPPLKNVVEHVIQKSIPMFPNNQSHNPT